MPKVTWEGGRSSSRHQTFFSPASRDYSAVSQEVVFPAGTTERSVAIFIVDDNVLEAVETFNVKMTVPDSHARVVLPDIDSATVTIIDDESEGLHWSTKCL